MWPSYLANIMYFNEVQLNQDLKLFNWNKLQHSYFLCQKSLLCWVPFNHDKIRFRPTARKQAEFHLQ